MSQTKLLVRMTYPPRFSTLTITHLSLLLCVSIIFTLSTQGLLIFAQAQQEFVHPISVTSPTFARTITKLYVLGGATVFDSNYLMLSQFLSLDLNLTWTSTSPAWTRLPEVPYLAFLPAVFSSDERTLYVFQVDGTNSPVQYDVNTNSWLGSIATKFDNGSWKGAGAVTDPRTGLVYLAGGFEDIQNGSRTAKKMDIFDPIFHEIRTFNMSSLVNFLTPRLYYGNVWSKYRNSTLYWGGSSKAGDTTTQSSVDNSIVLLNTDSLTWSMLLLKGDAPVVKHGHCMAANENGTKVAIYGGYLRNGTIVGELWVLDLVTSTWHQGASGLPRANMACTIAGDQFLIWGGVTSQPTPMNTAKIIIYNLTSSKYVEQYTPPAFYNGLKPPPSLTRTTALWPMLDPVETVEGLTRPPTPIGVTVGESVAGLVSMAVLGGIYVLYRRKRRQKAQLNGQGGDKQGIGGASRGLLELFRLRQGGRRDDKEARKDPQETDEDEELERMLRELENQEKELVQKRQLLVLQHQESKPRPPTSEKRGPTAISDDKAEFISSPAPLPPLRSSSEPGYSMSYSPENLHDRRTVQAVSRPFDMYQGDSYADNGPRRESELAQDIIEPIYEPAPTVSNSIPDLIYMPSLDVGMDWTKQQQPNHPHAPIDASSILFNGGSSSEK